MLKEKSILAIFNREVQVTVDRKFLMDVVTFVRDFSRKSDRVRDHINFLGGNLIGVYSFLFLNEDDYNWVNNVLKINDFDKLQSDIYDLPDINKNFKVSSDAINLSFLWVTYRALTSDLPEKEKMILATAAIMGLQYRRLSSIHRHRFPYPADEGIAQMVYESLDNKSQLKKHGTWQAMLDARADDILGHDALHARVIRTLEPDPSIVAALNDMHTRLKSLVQGLTNKYHEIKNNQSKLVTTSKYTIVEGEAILKDSINSYSHIKTLMQHIVPDKHNFVKSDLVGVVGETIKTANEFYLNNTLYFISENYMVKHIKNSPIDIADLVDEIIMFSLTLLKKENIHLSNIPEVALKLRGVLASSRFKSDQYADIKEKMDFIVEHANLKINENAIISTRIATVFYITLRSLIAYKK